MQYLERNAGEDDPLLLISRRENVWSEPCKALLENVDLHKFLPPVIGINGDKIYYSWHIMLDYSPAQQGAPKTIHVKLDVGRSPDGDLATDKYTTLDFVLGWSD